MGPRTKRLEDLGLELLDVNLDELHTLEREPNIATAKRALADIQLRARTRYHALALELHPDRTGGDPETDERFKLVTAAYDVAMALEVRPAPPPPPVVQVGMTIRIFTATSGATSGATNTGVFTGDF